MTTELVPEFAALAGDDIDRQPWEPFGAIPNVHVKYLFRTATSVAGLMRIDPSVAEPRHLHVGGQHHVWVTDGIVHFDGRLLNPGSYLHVPEGMTHTMHTDEQGCTLFFVYLRQG